MSEQILSALGKKIFYDRYARKTHNHFVIGDKVLVKDNGSRESGFGTVLSLSDDSVTVKLENGDFLTCDKSNVAKPIETPKEMFKRVAQSVAKAEFWGTQEYDNLFWSEIPHYTTEALKDLECMDFEGGEPRRLCYHEVFVYQPEFGLKNIVGCLPPNHRADMEIVVYEVNY